MRVAAGIALLATLLACESGTGRDARLQVETIKRSDLPALDPDRTYESIGPVEDPEALVRDLLDRGIPVTRAWLPLGNECLDPIGPRFTVELSRPDGPILERGFRQGTGRLPCAPTLAQLVVLPD